MLSILHEDNQIIAVNKPAALLTQAPPEVPSVEALVKAWIKEKYAKPAGVYLGVPHRLDRPVSGVIVFARNSKAARRLAEQFQQRRAEKIYWALVEGNVEPESGAWEDWLRKIPEESRTKLAEPESPGAKPASLSYRKLQSIPGGTLLEIRPLTGRSHQIRIQAASRGHPVLGDVLYGSTQAFGPAAEQKRDAVIALHARSLTIIHPSTWQPLILTAPTPEYWPDSGLADERET
jgi:23S rRNA pseudouridine1911/1915/1917 synthase